MPTSIFRLPFLKCTFVSLTLAYAGCGKYIKRDDTDDAPKLNIEYAGLAMAAVDTKYSSSSFLYYDFAMGEISTVQSGESGDPHLFWRNDKLFWFNRNGNNINFSTSDVRADNKLLTKQHSTGGAVQGDPYDIAVLPDSTLLLANYNAGKLSVVNQETGAEVAAVQAEWDIPVDAKLKPVALWMKEIEAVSYVFVLHQGFSDTHAANGSQAIFVLKWNGTALEVVDQNKDKAKVQGIALAATAPDLFLLPETGRPLLVGLCSMYVGQPCTSSIQRFDPATMAVETIWDFGGFEYYMDGVARAADENYLFLPVMRRSGNVATGNRQIIKLNLSTHEVKVVHEIDTSVYKYGTWVIEYVPSTQSLFVAEPRSLTAGNLWLYKGDEAPVKIEVERIPYQSTLIPKP